MPYCLLLIHTIRYQSCLYKLFRINLTFNLFFLFLFVLLFFFVFLLLFPHIDLLFQPITFFELREKYLLINISLFLILFTKYLFNCVVLDCQTSNKYSVLTKTLVYMNESFLWALWTLKLWLLLCKNQGDRNYVYWLAWHFSLLLPQIL